MIPRAKKNLHECEYHLNKMLSSRHVEELEINFAAFVNSARSITWVLQNEFIGNSLYKEKFLKWYGDPKNPIEGTKAYEMKNDELCKFFNSLRTFIAKEGINKINCNTTIKRFNTSTDLVEKPTNSSVVINNKGIYYLVNKGTAQEDLLPVVTKGDIATTIFIENAPTKHRGKKIENNNLINISTLYFLYLKYLVEEWTEIINSKPDS